MNSSGDTTAISGGGGAGEEEEEAFSLPLTRHPDMKLVLDTPKGRGIFATRRIPANTILETCPVLVLDAEENKKHIEKTELFHYTYNWPLDPPSTPSITETKNSSSLPPPPPPPSPPTIKPPTTTQAIILGLGSMFNHSSLHQNVGWKRDIKNKLITYTTLRDILPNEELCISYGARLTFVDTEAVEQRERQREEEEREREDAGGVVLGGIWIDGDDEEEEHEDE